MFHGFVSSQWLQYQQFVCVSKPFCQNIWQWLGNSLDIATENLHPISSDDSSFPNLTVSSFISLQFFFLKLHYK
jgi:hypothetical protein